MPQNTLMERSFFGIMLLTAALLIGTVGLTALLPGNAEAASEREVLQTYSDIAEATYEDSLLTAKALRHAVKAFITTPNEATLQDAKAAWLQARVPYQQTEAYRFGNAIVDDWEGRVNAWPLDEGLIDYVASGYGTDSDENELYTANVIANRTLLINGKSVDASRITKELLSSTLHEAGGVEANVAIGYHAIEFLLWGQDLNGSGPGAGQRPATDFDTANCTGGNCQRRVGYLWAATDLLVGDLEEMVANWRTGGAARSGLLNGNPKAGISAMLTGLGSLSYGELAGERMQLGLMLHDPEEEHDCFSDNTHNSHYYDQLGMINVYTGKYVRTDGRMVSGPSLAALTQAQNPQLHKEMLGKFHATLFAMTQLKKTAEAGHSYDQMLVSGAAAGNQLVQEVVDRLKDQTRSIERLVVALSLDAIAFEGSDSLDNPGAVFQ